MIKCKIYIFNKHFETKKELAKFADRIREIVRAFNFCNHRLKESTQFNILYKICSALICLKVEIEHLSEEVEK